MAYFFILFFEFTQNIVHSRKNMDIHSGTGKSPITLLNIEKDSLQPLSTKTIRSPYQRYRQLHKVNPT